MAFRFPQGYAAVGAIIDRFLEAILHSTSTFFCGSPTGGCRQNRYHCNKVAPTARIYLHLICRKRHLPLKLRKGKTFRGAFTICRYVFCGCPTGGCWQNRYSGTASLFPARVRSKNQLRTNVARQFYGLVSNFDTGLPEIAVSVAASNRL